MTNMAASNAAKFGVRQTRMQSPSNFGRLSIMGSNMNFFKLNMKETPDKDHDIIPKSISKTVMKDKNLWMM